MSKLSFTTGSSLGGAARVPAKRVHWARAIGTFWRRIEGEHASCDEAASAYMLSSWERLGRHSMFGEFEVTDEDPVALGVPPKHVVMYDVKIEPSIKRRFDAKAS